MDLSKNKTIAPIPSDPTFAKYVKQMNYSYVSGEWAIFLRDLLVR